ATISCVANKFLQQSPFDRDEYLSKLEKPSAEIFTYQHKWIKKMLIETFIPAPDVIETHKIEIAASRESVYQALWTTDLGGSPVIKGLMALRSLPGLLLQPGRIRRQPQKITLQTIIEAGFGRLAEEQGREVVLGVTGRFWRPTGNVQPFDEESFLGPARRGFAR